MQLESGEAVSRSPARRSAGARRGGRCDQPVSGTKRVLNELDLLQLLDQWRHCEETSIPVGLRYRVRRTTPINNISMFR